MEFDYVVPPLEEFWWQEGLAGIDYNHKEGLCVQCMHIGSYDNEPATIKVMHGFMREHGYGLDISEKDFIMRFI